GPRGACCAMNDLSAQENLDPAPPDPAPPALPLEGEGAPAAPSPCPRCKKPLTDPGGLRWCPACGYCPLLAVPGPQGPPPAPRKPSKLGAVEFFQVLGITPAWLCVLLGGVFFIVAWSVTAEHMLPGGSFLRFAWSSGQLLLGILVVAAAHVWVIKTVPSLEV